MKIAIVGCCHGKLSEVYEQVNNYEQKNEKVRLILICGDFQAVRGVNDLKCMAVPDKYKELGDFHAYYRGDKQATHLTLVVGGNHEASNYFQSLPYGGWIAPKIYYLGYSNVVRFNGLKIGAVSGIFKQYNTGKGHFEHLPYNFSTLKSVYHTRYLEVFRILQLKEKIDIMLTHDWPLHVYNMPGAREYLLRIKKHFRDDINNHQLGSPMYELILNRLRPKHWFAAHLHVRFETKYVHKSFRNKIPDSKPTDQQIKQTNESSQSDERIDDPTKDEKLTDENGKADIIKQPETTNQQQQKTPEQQTEMTHFLALDKCLPRRKYLEFVEIESDESKKDAGFEYDLEWLAILRCTNQYVSTQEYPSNCPPQPHVLVNYDLDADKEFIKERLKGDFKIPENFQISLPYNSAGEDEDPDRMTNYVNEQTTTFCNLIELTDPIQSIIDRLVGRTSNPDKISLSDDEECSKDECTNQDEDIDEPSAKKFKEDENQLFFIDTKGSK